MDAKSRVKDPGPAARAPIEAAALVFVIGQVGARLRALVEGARAGVVGAIRAVPRQQQGRSQPSCQHLCQSRSWPIGDGLTKLTTSQHESGRHAREQLPFG